jgi:hypothetical protein
MKLNSKISPFIEKLQQAADGYCFKREERPDPIYVLATRLGSHFCYGSLTDPALLSETLGLAEMRTLRPAKLVSYSLKLWGQYPALVDVAPRAVVEGMVYDVEHEKHAERLAEYETQAYWPTLCLIHVTDSEEPKEVTGMTFKYVGNPLDIGEGDFDLSVWLKRMGRAGIEGGAP